MSDSIGISIPLSRIMTGLKFRANLNAPADVALRERTSLSLQKLAHIPVDQLLPDTVIFHLTMLDRRVIFFHYVNQAQTAAAVAFDGESNRVGRAVFREAAAFTAGVSAVAEVALDRLWRRVQFRGPRHTGPVIWFA